MLMNFSDSTKCMGVINELSSCQLLRILFHWFISQAKREHFGMRRLVLGEAMVQQTSATDGRTFAGSRANERTGGSTRVKANICVNKRVVAFSTHKPKRKESQETLQGLTVSGSNFI
jgi:hypothetical protein